MLRAAVALLFLLLLPSGAHAEKRVALVIGNSSYRMPASWPIQETTQPTWRRP